MAPDLVGKRVLVLLILAKDPRNAYALAGVVRSEGAKVEVWSDDGATVLPLRPFDIERNSFAADVLPNLVGDDRYLPLAQGFAHTVDRCIAMLIDRPPEGMRPMPGFVGGLAVGRDGKLFLMQVR
jgi:hypothetical protein